MRENLIIRTDASAEIGTGHAMRCIALAQEWEAGGGNVEFVSATLPDAIIKRINEGGFSMHSLSSEPYTEHDASETVNRAKELGASWVVVDGYNFSSEYQKSLKEHDTKVLFIDDYGHADHYFADLILNQNVYASEDLYKSRETETKLMLGTKFAVLRQEFASGRSEKEIAPEAKRILVTLGGADPKNVTSKVIEALDVINDLEIKIVVGGSNPNLDAVKSVCEGKPIDLIVDASNMRELMEWADIAVSGGGTTCYELACMGLPTATIILSDNQEKVALGMEEAGAAINLGWYTEVSPESLSQPLKQLIEDNEKRASLSLAGKKLVDGFGAARVCRTLANEKVWLRPANLGDAEMILEWTNDPENRAASFSSDLIELPDHIKWFKEKLNNPNNTFFIAHDEEGSPVGQIRFDQEGDAATISVSIAPEHRGKGLGKAIIVLGSQHIFASTNVSHIDAYVKEDNAASQAVFEKAGFEKKDSTHYILDS